MDTAFVFGLLCLCMVSICSSALTRKIAYTLNPDCNKMCEHYKLNETTEYNNIVHVQSSSDIDTLHFIWSTVGAPTVLIAKTDRNVSVKVDWIKLFSDDPSNALKFTGKVYYSFASVMSRIYEYDDKPNKAKVTDMNSTLIFDLSELRWQNVDDTLKESSDVLSATFITSNYSKEFLNHGTIKIKMMVSGKSDRMSELPHQQWTVNSTLVDFTIDGLKASYEKSRLIAEMIFIDFDESGRTQYKGNMDYYVKKTIDDEYTPSVFETYNMKTPASKEASEGGFIQWKPIAYTSSTRKYKDSTAMTANEIHNKNNPEIIPQSIAQAYFGKSISKAKMSNLTLKFGVATGKDFYTKSNYSSWSIAIGYGAAPKEEISLTVILVISIGLGLPVVLFISGGVYMLIKKLKGNTNSGQMLIVNVDE